MPRTPSKTTICKIPVMSWLLVRNYDEDQRQHLEKRPVLVPEEAVEDYCDFPEDTSTTAYILDCDKRLVTPVEQVVATLPARPGTFQVLLVRAAPPENRGLIDTHRVVGYEIPGALTPEQYAARWEQARASYRWHNEVHCLACGKFLPHVPWRANQYYHYCDPGNPNNYQDNSSTCPPEPRVVEIQ